ncbi:DUF3106 domain-containing protein [Terriglobus sp. 2YAB30_2]|uniref:DUF3106 domain-containing protein n=1 Tax=unclassified Terriglobus TaxID=2628988 RepID=UPI003F9CE443
MTLLALTAAVVMPVLAQQRRPAPQRQMSPAGGGGRGEHLAQWMDKHRNLTPQQQQNALRSEPGFQQLPPETQARVMGRLGQLNAMPPQQRERVINRAEAMEKLEPQQRQQVRGALSQLGALPTERRRLVARAFRDLRRMPPEQRQNTLNSPAYRDFTPQERSTLNNLMQVEPMLPQQP